MYEKTIMHVGEIWTWSRNIFSTDSRISDEAMFTRYRQSQESGHVTLFIKIY